MDKFQIKRVQLHEKIKESFEVTPICALLGPRQSGKTTLALQYAKQLDIPIHHFDLEDPNDLIRLEDPILTLSVLTGLIIIDEIQLKPHLFPILRVLVDKNDQKFLILGSASRTLVNQSSETLAGRITYIEVTPFNLWEVEHTQDLWYRGGFPRSFLAKTDKLSHAWRKTYVQTFLEHDIPQLGIQIPAMTLRKFWMMLAHYHGNVLNTSELGRSLGYSDTTIKRYLDILSGTLMVRVLQPWFENIAKRQVRTPKIYFRDTGILHTLLHINTREQLPTHPKLGASWEGFALEEIIRFHQAAPEDCFFWGTHNQAELDLMLFIEDKRIGFEFKYGEAPKLTRSMQIAMHDLKLDQLIVITPHPIQYPLAAHIHVTSLESYLQQNHVD